MSGTGRPLTWHEIEACLRDLGDELERRGLERRTIVIVGGAFVAHHAIRRATTDVDVITALDDDIRAAAAAVAGRNGLEPDWLNDRARPWQPSTFDPGSCRTALVHGALEVLMPGVDDVILMKIAAGNRTPNDQLDLRALWPSSSFTTPQAAVEAFNKAYPLEDPDPYLADWIATVVDGSH